MSLTTRFLRLSITKQASLFLALMLSMASSVLYFWAVDNGQAQELAHSRTVADMADSFRAMVAKNGSIYIRRVSTSDVATVGRYLTEYDSPSNVVNGQVVDYKFHQKNPFLAIGDFSTEVLHSPAEAKFRMASDNPMNPANHADSFELQALDKIRATNLNESWQVTGQYLRYARALVAAKACLACHGDPDSAPAFIRDKYRTPIGSKVGGGYGWVEGQIVGVTSVSVPHSSPMDMLAKQGAGFWVSAIAFISITVLAYFAVIGGVVKPMKRLTRYVKELATTLEVDTVKPPHFDTEESTSGNEIHQQAHKIKALHETVAAAMNHITHLNARSGK